jgi:hypothetical protein
MRNFLSARVFSHTHPAHTLPHFHHIHKLGGSGGNPWRDPNRKIVGVLSFLLLDAAVFVLSGYVCVCVCVRGGVVVREGC